MNKKIKGYEVMKLIAEKQIKNKQEFLFTTADGVEEKIFWNGENFKCSEAENSFVLRTVSDIEFAVGDFEILEDERKIGIQDIKIFEQPRDLSIWSNDTLSKNQRSIIEKVNKLVKAVKLLDKKINKED